MDAEELRQALLAVTATVKGVFQSAEVGFLTTGHQNWSTTALSRALHLTLELCRGWHAASADLPCGGEFRSNRGGTHRVRLCTIRACRKALELVLVLSIFYRSDFCVLTVHQCLPLCQSTWTD